MFTSAVIRDSSGAATATMMVASRRVDLNLNHAPVAAYEDPVREGLKQAMIQHEIVFKNQVRELHRLYWTQKNLMNEVYWGRTDRVSVHRGSEEEQEEEIAGVTGSPLPTVNLMQMRMRNFDLQLPAEEFIEDATDEFADEFMQGNSSGSNACAFGAGHMNLDLNTIQDGVNSSLADISANMCHSLLSNLYSVSRIPHESCCLLKEKYSHTKHQAERWQENLIHSNVGLKEHGASLSANSSPYEKPHTKPRLMHIDLNIAQDDEPVNISTEDAETNHSPSTNSSVVLDGDNLRVSIVNRNAEESTVLQPGAVSLGSENSREKGAGSLPGRPKDSSPPWFQASNQSSDAIGNRWSHREYLANDEVRRSRCHKSLMERLCGDYNRETEDSAIGAVLDFHKPVKQIVDLSVLQPDFAEHSDSRKNVSDSSNCMEHDSLHASAGSTNQPRNIAVGFEEQPMHNERNEEDTVSSHAIDLDEEQQDEVKESPTGIELNRLSQDGGCTSKAKCASKNAVISNSETTHAGSVSPERTFAEQVPNFGGDPSRPKELNVEQDRGRVSELDNLIVKAAEALVSILSYNLSRSLDRSNSCGQMVLDDDDEGNDHPHISDSFEALTLTLQEEVADNASSACVGRTADETREDVRRIQLRRGRRLRDFQKDILPGMISLSRQEICEDLYAIKYELRKKRSRRTCENWSVPVRSRRSRLSVGRRR